MQQIILFSFMLLVSVGVVDAGATQYWVSTTGSDANSCVSASGDSDPGVYKLTPANAELCLVGGDTLTIKAGTYNNTSARIRSIPSGTVSNPTIVQGDPSSTVGCAIAHTCGTILKPTGTNTNSYVTASNIIIRKIDFDHQGVTNNSYPFRLGGPCTNVVLEDIETHSTLANSPTSTGASGLQIEPECNFVTVTRLNSHDNGNLPTTSHHGIYNQGDDILVQDSWLHDNGNAGFQCYNSGATSGSVADRCTFIHNLIEGNHQAAGYNEGNDSIFYGNVIRDNFSGMGIGFGSSNRVQFVNNVVYNNGSVGVQFGASNGGANSIAKNNIVFGHSVEISVLASASGTVLEYNACGSSDACGTTGKLTISALTDCIHSTSDPSLISGSPCIDTGTPVSGFVYNGAAPDIGAYESFGYASGTVIASTLEVSLGMNLNTPVTPTSAGWSIACTPNPTACPTPTISSVVLKSGSSSVVQITWTGGNCSGNQIWTVSYDRSTGNTTDGIGLTVKQELSTISAQSVTNNCTGGGGGSPPAGPYIHYKMDDGSGTNVNDETANNLDGTLTNTPTWVTGKTGSGINIAAGSSQYIAVPYGNGVNPTTQSLTIAIWIYITPGSENTAAVIPFATPVGTNQRMYVASSSGTWRIAIQSSNSGTASDLSVSPGWNRLCLTMNSGTNTATLHKNGVAATSSGGVKTYTSYSFSGNIQIGQLPANTSSAGIYDEFKVWQSVASCADDYTSYETGSSALGTFSQPAYRFQNVYTTSGGSSENLSAVNTAQSVMAGGAVALVIQVNCDNVSDCAATSFILRYSTDGSTFSNVVPDVATSDGVAFWVGPTGGLLNNGVTTGALTGALSHTNGPTQLTTAATPSLDLSQNTSATLRYILRFSSSIAGQARYFKLYHQTGEALDSYTPSSGAQAIIMSPVSTGF